MMNEIAGALSAPLPWYFAGPLIGLMVPLLLLAGNRRFGVSSSLRHICSACFPSGSDFFDYDWRRETWSFLFVAGIVAGGFFAGQVFTNPEPVALSPEIVKGLAAMGVHDFAGLHPEHLFSWSSLTTLRGSLLIAAGGFLVGFGTRYAGGCTSGHSVYGISCLEPGSVMATCAFFAGGLLMSWLLLPFILRL